MSRIIITIETENADFVDYPDLMAANLADRVRVAVLRDLPEFETDIVRHPKLVAKVHADVSDVNGNSVGTVRIDRGDVTVRIIGTDEN